MSRTRIVRQFWAILIAASLTVAFAVFAKALGTATVPEKVLSVVLVTVCDRPYSFVFTTDRGRLLTVDHGNKDKYPLDLLRGFIREAKEVTTVNIQLADVCGTSI